MKIVQAHLYVDPRFYYNEAQTLLYLKETKQINREFRQFLRDYRKNNLNQIDLFEDEKKGL